MKKTDTCYYMSITKEENSAFVVANNQTPGGDPSQVVIESKTETSTMGGNTSGPGTGATTLTTPTTTLSANVAAATAASGGNGTIGIGASNIQHRRYSNGLKTSYDASRGEAGEPVSPGKPRIHVPPPGAPPPPQVILQVLPSTPTLQHHNLLASDVHRECRMRLRFFFYHFLLLFLHY